MSERATRRHRKRRERMDATFRQLLSTWISVTRVPLPSSNDLQQMPCQVHIEADSFNHPLDPSHQPSRFVERANFSSSRRSPSSSSSRRQASTGSSQVQSEATRRRRSENARSRFGIYLPRTSPRGEPRVGRDRGSGGTPRRKPALIVTF